MYLLFGDTFRQQQKTSSLNKSEAVKTSEGATSYSLLLRGFKPLQNWMFRSYYCRLLQTIHLRIPKPRYERAPGIRETRTNERIKKVNWLHHFAHWNSRAFFDQLRSNFIRCPSNQWKVCNFKIQRSTIVYIDDSYRNYSIVAYDARLRLMKFAL